MRLDALDEMKSSVSDDRWRKPKVEAGLSGQQSTNAGCSWSHPDYAKTVAVRMSATSVGNLFKERALLQPSPKLRIPGPTFACVYDNITEYKAKTVSVTRRLTRSGADSKLLTERGSA